MKYKKQKIVEKKLLSNLKLEAKYSNQMRHLLKQKKKVNINKKQQLKIKK